MRLVPDLKRIIELKSHRYTSYWSLAFSE